MALAGTVANTGFETGFLIFQEMCGGQCGALPDPCDGTCITGNFWGLDFDASKPELHRNNKRGLHITEFASINPLLPAGCSVTGGIWNPEGVSHGKYNEDPREVGTLLYALANPTGQCTASPYEYCDPAGRIKFSGPESIIGRSVTMRKEHDRGAAYTPDENENPMSCGTIGTEIFNPN